MKRSDYLKAKKQGKKGKHKKSMKARKRDYGMNTPLMKQFFKE